MCWVCLFLFVCFFKMKGMLEVNFSSCLIALYIVVPFITTINACIIIHSSPFCPLYSSDVLPIVLLIWWRKEKKKINEVSSELSSVTYPINSLPSVHPDWPCVSAHMWFCLLPSRICFHVTSLILVLTGEGEEWKIQSSWRYGTEWMLRMTLMDYCSYAVSLDF